MLPGRGDSSDNGGIDGGVVKFVPFSLERIPAPAVRDYQQVYSDIDSSGVGLLTGADVRAAFKVNHIDITAPELDVFVKTLERVSFGDAAAAAAAASAGGCITITPDAFAQCLHALVIQHREVGDASLYAVFPDSDFTAQTATGMLRLRRRMWVVLDEPNSSAAARVVSSVIIGVILLSTASFICETYPALRRNGDFAIFDAIEAASVAVFTLEVVLRVLCTPDLRHYFTNALNVIDVISVAPFYLDLVLSASAASGGATATVLRVIRLVRVFRLMKISRYVTWMRLLARTLRQSLAPLGMVLFMTAIAIIFFSSIEYYTERGEWSTVVNGFVMDAEGHSFFGSIPQTFWWCIITMTTVGYGDTYPITPLGKVEAVFAFFTGILLLAIPISVISSNFHGEFARVENLQRLRLEHAARVSAHASSVSAATATSGASSWSLASVVPRPLHRFVRSVADAANVAPWPPMEPDPTSAASNTAFDASAADASLRPGAGSPAAADVTVAEEGSQEERYVGPFGDGTTSTSGAESSNFDRVHVTAARERLRDTQQQQQQQQRQPSPDRPHQRRSGGSHNIVSEWSEPFLRSTLQAVRHNRRRLMSKLKQTDLSNRESAVGEVRDFVADLAVRDVARATLVKAADTDGKL